MDGTHPWGFTVIGKLEHMDHVLGLLLFHVVPAAIRQLLHVRSHGIVVLFPALSGEDGVRFGQWLQLKLGRLVMLQVSIMSLGHVSQPVLQQEQRCANKY